MSDNLEESEHQDHEQQEKEIETVNQTEFCIESILLNSIVISAHDN